jgi:hypothetical protein
VPGGIKIGVQNDPGDWKPSCDTPFDEDFTCFRYSYAQAWRRAFHNRFILNVLLLSSFGDKLAWNSFLMHLEIGSPSLILLLAEGMGVEIFELDESFVAY